MRHSLRLQLLSLIGGSLLLILIVALGSAQLLWSSVRDYQGLLNGPLQASDLVNEANLQFKTQVQEWKNVLLRGGQPADLDKYWGRFEEQERQVQATLSRLDGVLANDTELTALVTQLRADHQALGQAYRRGLEAFRAADAEPAAGDRAVQGVDRATSEEMSALVERLQQGAASEAAGLAAAAERLHLIGVAALIGLGVLAMFVSFWLVNRRFIEPLHQATVQVGRLSRGQFGDRMAVQREDELGQLMAATNTLRDFLSDTFERLSRSNRELDQASGQLSGIAGRMAQGSSEQFNRTDQVATAMHQMSATAQEVARHAGDAAHAADEADASAQEGERVMQATIHTITRMRGEIASTAEVIRQLENDSGRIGKVLEVIRGIADQTNLLALNAAIEAARAGEAGRGFAVVADEVRTLAQRTAESTAEINQIIDTVQTGAVNAVRAIESGQARSDEGVEQVTQAGATLQRITDAVEAIREMNRQIATAAEEQTAVTEDISRNLTDITSIANRNQDSMQSIQRAGDSLHGLSRQMSEIMAALGR